MRGFYGGIVRNDQIVEHFQLLCNIALERAEASVILAAIDSADRRSPSSASCTTPNMIVLPRTTARAVSDIAIGTKALGFLLKKLEPVISARLQPIDL